MGTEQNSVVSVMGQSTKRADKGAKESEGKRGNLNSTKAKTTGEYLCVGISYLKYGPSIRSAQGTNLKSLLDLSRIKGGKS